MIFPEPVFLNGSAGKLFTLCFPSSGRGERGVVLLPPFAEEMNLSRRMLRIQAEALAERGITALVLDLFGTGDSAGDFAEASWEIWINDVRVAADALRAHGCDQIGLLGLRLGALLAAVAARQLPNSCFTTVLWQPVVVGRAYLNKFLRIRALAGISGVRPPPTIAEMNVLLERGETVEVAGYTVSPKLAAALTMLDLSQLGSFMLGPVTWLEIRRVSAENLSAVAENCVADWRAVGVIVDGRSVNGVPFWAVQGNRVNLDLVAVTSSIFASAA